MKIKATTTKALALLLAALSLIEVSFGEVFSDAAALAESRIYAQNSWFDCVGLYGAKVGDVWYSYGTAVLIGDGSWVLISGHQKLNVPAHGDEGFILHKPDGSTKSITVASGAYVHPGCSPGFYDYGDDVALLKLISAATEATPATFYAGQYTRGMSYSMAGFGLPGIAGQATMAFDGIKRAGNNIGNSFGGDIRIPGQGPQYVGADFDSPSSGNALPLEWLGAN